LEAIPTDLSDPSATWNPSAARADVLRVEVRSVTLLQSGLCENSSRSGTATVGRATNSEPQLNAGGGWRSPSHLIKSASPTVPGRTRLRVGILVISVYFSADFPHTDRLTTCDKRNFLAGAG
jgi:hypothetical protein